MEEEEKDLGGKRRHVCTEICKLTVLLPIRMQALPVNYLSYKYTSYLEMLSGYCYSLSLFLLF